MKNLISIGTLGLTGAVVAGVMTFPTSTVASSSDDNPFVKREDSTSELAVVDDNDNDDDDPNGIGMGNTRGSNTAADDTNTNTGDDANTNTDTNTGDDTGDGVDNSGPGSANSGRVAHDNSGPGSADSGRVAHDNSGQVDHDNSGSGSGGDNSGRG